MSRPIRTEVSESSLRLIGIPTKFLHTKLSEFETKDSDSLEAVKDFVTDYILDLDENFEKNAGVFFNGSNGVGKTMLSSIILRAAYKKRYTSRRCTFVEYIDKYTAEWSAKNGDEKEEASDRLYTYYKAVEFLVLEEIGKEVDSKVSAPILEDLLRYREDHGLPTIICTNLNVDTLREKYGNSCMSLLQGNMTPITIESKDVRSKSFKKRLKRVKK